MPERNIALYIIKEVQKVCAENNVKEVHWVTMQIGTVSVINNDRLMDCWQQAVKQQENMADCKLIIEPIEAISHCDNCNQNYDTIKYKKICPYCQSEKTYLLQGDNVVIKEINVTTAD